MKKEKKTFTILKGVRHAQGEYIIGYSVLNISAQLPSSPQ